MSYTTIKKALIADLFFVGIAAPVAMAKTCKATSDGKYLIYR